MEIVSAREFRSNQGKFLTAARKGESLILTSRYGNFKIVPVSKDDSLTARIAEGLGEVKLIESGKIPAKTAKSFLDEL
ncbi:MAG: type II toxin-antitoxin system Phd/YefM family antitoxin [Duncaniella sp.]|nr:type II toxin-antitoxin system Phd/YefM family antitoxin [Duncaniella sp.]